MNGNLASGGGSLWARCRYISVGNANTNAEGSTRACQPHHAEAVEGYIESETRLTCKGEDEGREEEDAEEGNW